MIEDERIPDPWEYHTYVNNEHFYTDQENLVEIGVSESGRLRVYNTSGHPNSPQKPRVNEDYDTEESAEQEAIKWMTENNPPVPN